MDKDPRSSHMNPKEEINILFDFLFAIFLISCVFYYKLTYI